MVETLVVRTRITLADRQRYVLLCCSLAAFAQVAVSGCAMGSRGSVARGVVYARELSQRGIDALHNGEVDEAERHFEEAIDHCPTNATARFQLANCLWKKGEHQQAISRLSEAIDMTGGEDPEMLIELAYMQANQGNMASAKALAERVIQAVPDDPRAWQLQGEVLKEAGQWKDSLASLHRALALAPNNIHVQLATAEIYQQLNRPQRALATLNHVQEQFPSDGTPESVLVMKSDALRALGRHDDAYTVLAEANQRRRLSRRGQQRLAQAREQIDRRYNRQQPIKQARRPAELSQQAADRHLTQQPLSAPQDSGPAWPL